MPVRIFFRGLVLFRFPGDGRIVAELISEPEGRNPGGNVPPGQDDHEATIQIVTGEDAREKLPRVLRHGARLDITIPSPLPAQQPPPPPVRAASYNQYVPKISRLAELANLARRPEGEDDRYVRNTITVNRGTIRVKDVVQWDDGGYPFFGNPDTPAAGAVVKFMGVEVRGHAANECVVEIPDTDVVNVDVDHPAHRDLDGLYRSTRRRNQHAQSSTTNIIIQNYEYQREKPVWWALDFQWYFARLGWGPVNLAGDELDRFDTNGRRFEEPFPDDQKLYSQDRASLLPETEGRPFPYIEAVNAEGVRPWLRWPGAPGDDIESRPVCIPGDE